MQTSYFTAGRSNKEFEFDYADVAAARGRSGGLCRTPPDLSTKTGNAVMVW